MLLIRSRTDLSVVVGSTLRRRSFRIVATKGNLRKVSHFCGCTPSLVVTSIVVPRVSKFRVVQQVQGRGGRIPMLFLDTHSSASSVIFNFRLKTGSCIHGPFDLHRLIIHTGTLLVGCGRRRKEARFCRVKLCAFCPGIRALLVTKRDSGLSCGRSRVLGHLYRGRGRPVCDGSVLLDL